jgi:hypothetical protein
MGFLFAKQRIRLEVRERKGEWNVLTKTGVILGLGMIHIHIFPITILIFLL